MADFGAVSELLDWIEEQGYITQVVYFLLFAQS